MKTKDWYSSEEISQLCNVHTRTIERKRNQLLEVNPDIDWFRMSKKPYKYSYKMIGEFMSPQVFELIKRNYQLARTIDCMHRTNTLEQHLSFLDWNYFVTIAPVDTMSKQKCYSAMSELYEMIEAYSFGDSTRMFFTTEPFSNRKGYHNHFILKMDGNIKGVTDFIMQYAPIGRVDVKPYDPELAGVFYICKEGKNGEDWDLFGNRLEQDGLQILMNK